MLAYSDSIKSNVKDESETVLDKFLLVAYTREDIMRQIPCEAFKK